MYFIIDGEEFLTRDTSANKRALNEVIPALPHGSHSLEVYFTSIIEGQTVTSNKLYYDLICTEVGNTTPIIASEFTQVTANQTDNLLIPYRVYTPEATNSVVDLYVDGVKIATRTVDRSSQTGL